MFRRTTVACLSVVLVYLVLSFASAEALVRSYVEDFTTTQYRDLVNTTAWWNTAAGELKLHPFEITLAGTYNTPGYAYGVAISGDYAYVADGSYGLQVIDISNPMNPTRRGSYNTPGDARGVAISGDYAYVADGSYGLQVIDISNPISPVLGGSYDTFGTALGVAISGNYAYIADQAYGLAVIDISDPTNPVLGGSYDTPGNALAVAISGDCAYVADGVTGLRVIDISNPTNPTYEGVRNTPGAASGVAISGDYAYIADAAQGLQVINISNPASPTIAGSYDTPGNALGVAISGDYVYVADDESGIQVFDISNPAAPAFTDTYELPGDAYGVVITGDYAYIADYSAGLQVLDIGDLATPSLAGFCSTPDNAYDIAVSGNYAYVADWTSGLQVVDISDPRNPTLRASYNTPGDARRVAISGDYAYVADYASGLLVIDISNPTSPTYEGSYDTPSNASGVSISGDYAYVADYLSGLQVIDISNPASPTYAGSYNTPGYAYAVAISGDYAYIADYLSGLQVIDISNPASPTYAGGYDTPGTANGVAISGDHAYVADGASGLLVIDISNPASPTYAGSYDTPGNALGVTVLGDYAYVADRQEGLLVVDISNPAAPALATSYDTLGFAYISAISGDYAYVADGAAGVRVVEIFQRHFYPDLKTARSITLDNSDDTILTARLSAAQIDSIRWELSADGGVNWQEFAPDGTWQAFTSTGSNIRWRSVHVYRATEPEINPTCTNLEIEWLYEFPVIEPISDIPGDQGRQVRIAWARSDHDDPGSSTPVTEYAVFRKIDQGLPSLANSSAEGMDAGRGLVGYPPGDWDFVTTVPAYCEDSYSTVVPTLVDSTQSEGIQYSTFFIRAGTADPGAYFDAYPASGYSVDNLVPSPPGNLTRAGGWESRAYRGADWQESLPGQDSQSIISRGSDILRKSAYVYGITEPEVNPTGENLESGLLYESPVIESIEDIPGDQGLQVRIAWTRSDHDGAGSPTPVTEYAIFRQIDQGLSAYPSGEWDFVKTVPAYREDSYSTVVATLVDSTQSGGMQYSTFFVRAGTADPSTYFSSNPASGYSVDNLAPSPPPNLRMATSTEVAWDEAAEEDFNYFTVYGSDVPDLDPSATLIGHTIETAMDVTYDQYDYYHVTATDFSGNEGVASSVAGTGVGVDTGDGMPREFALRQNQPNPFASRTKISFDLPEPCAVRLEVVDVQGRVVRLLTDEAWVAGRHSVGWTGENDAGQLTGPGVYFVRIQAGSFRATRKMLLMK